MTPRKSKTSDDVFRILHISDPHFGAHHRFRQSEPDLESPTLSDVVARAIGKSMPGATIHAMVITGDVLTTGSPEEAELAVNGLKKLIGAIRLRPSHCILVPGNHDLDWNSVDEQGNRHYANYDSIVNQLKIRGFASSDLPGVVRLQPAAQHLPEVVVLALDSCKLEGKANSGIGRVGEAQLGRAEAILARRRRGDRPRVLVGAMHHHLLPIWSVERIWKPAAPRTSAVDRPSVTVDAIEVMHRLSQRGVSVFLHGHQHRFAVVRLDNLASDTSPMRIVAGASCGSRATTTESLRRGFSVLEVHRSRIDILEFVESKSNDAEFELNSKTVSLPGEVSRGYCDEQSYAPSEWTQVPDHGTDQSDLTLLFLSVVDCQKSRDQIRATFFGLRGARLAAAGSASLEAMYDLLGRWDLLIRFRSPSSRATTKLIREDLKRIGMHKGSEAADFSEHLMLDILNETSPEVARSRGLPPAKPVRTILGDTESYERLRCQRGFVYMRPPIAPTGASNFDQAIRDVLATNPEVAPIVQAVYVAQGALVIEAFMTCSQTSLLARLNRLLEPVLSKSEVQKSTMLCYGYEEFESAPTGTGDS